MIQPHAIASDEVESPRIWLSYLDGIPDDVVREFLDAVAADGVSVGVERRKAPAVHAALEWFLPSAIVVGFFLTKAYFDGLLKEAGKDHYHAIKKAVSGLWVRLFGPQRDVRGSVIGLPPGKASQHSEYSREFSMVAVTPANTKIKLLVRSGASREVFEAAVSAFLEFLRASFDEDVPEARLGEGAPVTCGYIFVAYDPATRSLQVLNPLPSRNGGGLERITDERADE